MSACKFPVLPEGCVIESGRRQLAIGEKPLHSDRYYDDYFYEWRDALDCGVPVVSEEDNTQCAWSRAISMEDELKRMQGIRSSWEKQLSRDDLADFVKEFIGKIDAAIAALPTGWPPSAMAPAGYSEVKVTEKL